MLINKLILLYISFRELWDFINNYLLKEISFLKNVINNIYKEIKFAVQCATSKLVFFYYSCVGYLFKSDLIDFLTIKGIYRFRLLKKIEPLELLLIIIEIILIKSEYLKIII